LKLRIAFALFLATLPAWAQCSLCRLAVEQDPSLGKAFNKGIILMMIPALAVFTGVFVAAIRSTEGKKKNSESATDYSAEHEQP
jgi:hypothetical protein